jgi:hypothetical protein
MRGVRVIGQVHDSLLFEGPGHLKLDLAQSEWRDDVLIKPHWIIPDSVYEWTQPIKQAMIDAETECFKGVLEGRVGDPCISQYWAKD